MNVDVNKLVDQLQQIGGQLVTHVLRVYIRQQFNIGITELVIGVLQALVAIILAVTTIILIRKVIHWWAEWSEAETSLKNDFPYTNSPGRNDVAMRKENAEVRGWVAGILAAVTGCVGFVLAIVSVNTLYDAVLHLLNPEYFAIQQILGR